VRPATPPPLRCSNCDGYTTGPVMRWGSSRREHIVCERCCGPDVGFPDHCAWCERPFRYRGQGRRRYCTEHCRRQASAVRTGRLSGIDEATCAVCENRFVGRRADAIYCSPSCRQLAYRRRRASNVASVVAPL
jgi:hypothetical protein